MKLRRILATTAATAVLSTVALASPAVAKEPVGGNDSPIMLGDRQMTTVRGVDSWVNIGLMANTELENVRITVEENKNGTDVVYPAYGTSTGLSQGATLPQGGIDNAAFMLSTSGQSSDKFDLTVIATWEEGGDTHRAEIGTIQVKLIEHDGEDYAFVSESATVSSTGDGSGNWVDMNFLGIAPINSDFDVKIKNGLDEVYYPQESYTSLHHNDRLDGQEEDIARIWIDPATVEPGTYTIEIEVKYTNNKGKDSKGKHEMTITVV
jgi:hypothetical protein